MVGVETDSSNYSVAYNESRVVVLRVTNLKVENHDIIAGAEPHYIDRAYVVLLGVSKWKKQGEVLHEGKAKDPSQVSLSLRGESHEFEYKQLFWQTDLEYQTNKAPWKNESLEEFLSSELPASITRYISAW